MSIVGQREPSRAPDDRGKRMKPYVIRQGDYLARLAQTLRFDAAQVWNHARNEPLRTLRKHSEVLLPGDVLYVPDPSDEPLAVEVGSGNSFRGNVARVELVVVSKDGNGRPRGGVKAWVHGLGAVREETTGGDGKLTLKVPVDTRKVSVVFEGDARVYQLRVGNLDPVEETTGVRQRLIALGYLLDQLDADGAMLRDAIKRFQKTQGLTETGEADDAMRAKLRAVHRS